MKYRVLAIVLTLLITAGVLGGVNAFETNETDNGGNLVSQAPRMELSFSAGKSDGLWNVYQGQEPACYYFAGGGSGGNTLKEYSKDPHDPKSKGY